MRVGLAVLLLKSVSFLPKAEEQFALGLGRPDFIKRQLLIVKVNMYTRIEYTAYVQNLMPQLDGTTSTARRRPRFPS